jgi:superfamily I DNA and/or RNA helicase
MFKEQLPFTMLQVQYRMKPDISSFPSTAFYNGSTINGPNVIKASYDTPICRGLIKDQPFCFVEVDGLEQQNRAGSFSNEEEAEHVTAILLDLKRRISGSNSRTMQPTSPWSPGGIIRVITFYRAQVDLISHMLEANGIHNVEVSSVDSSQGSEANIIVISFVRTGKMGTIGFLTDDRRLNVALTRAKHKLICVGCSTGLRNLSSTGTSRQGSSKMCALIKNVVERELVVKSSYTPKLKAIRANFKGAYNLPQRGAKSSHKGRNPSKRQYRGHSGATNNTGKKRRKT